MPGGFKDNPSNDTSHQSSTSATTYQDNLTPTATTMRSANVVNPHGSAYEVAGPFTGGTSSVHNRALDAVKGQSLDSPFSGSGGAPAHSLTEKDCAAAAVMSAAAAGAYDLDSQHNTNLHPISNTNNTLASPTVSSPMTPSSITTGSSGSPSLKPLGPHDRPPIKVAIHAHKPSDKATYGNLDSPGAQNHPGPLSDFNA
ncbi:hypothetical protein BGZ97_005036 [Linnemannia gamsii]|uniref:Uncharacterized protein n=1 Tax=Linnemannia gamsii TaxID=64522 RepID=A0A9P6QRE1_9FUNG|nr:hypothetical protein BGZ97_005036 [Linnemannia gamsii]